MKDNLLQLINSFILILRERITSSRDSPVTSCCLTLQQRINLLLHNTWSKVSHRFTTTGCKNNSLDWSTYKQPVRVWKQISNPESRLCYKENWMKPAFTNHSLEKKELKEINNELNKIVLYRLESIRENLEDQFCKENLSADIHGHLNKIYCLIDKTRKVANDNTNYHLIQKINSIHENIKLVLKELKDFGKEYQQPVPERVFQNLNDLLNSCSEDLESFENALAAIYTISKNLKCRCTTNTLKAWADGIDLFNNSLNNNIELFSYDLLQHLEIFSYQILERFSRVYQNLENEKYRKRLLISAQFILDSIKQRRLNIEKEDEELTLSLYMASESAFSEIWLSPEEDEAWNNL